jgi:glutamate formiminotransferase/formiminotetrahydrofolate cyclodeaminase
VSLLIMVAGLPKTRAGTPEEAADLAEASPVFVPLRDLLTSLVDEDSAAYAAVVQAMQLPKESAAEKTSRRGAIDAAMREATDVPLDTMRACQQALRGALVVAAGGNASALTEHTPLASNASHRLARRRHEHRRQRAQRQRC